MVNALTIDVEDYYQVSAFESIIKFNEWNLYKNKGRVVENTKKMLDILRKKNIKATFFVLGWIAQNYPKLVRQIKDEGHEIGSHGYAHRIIYQQTPEEFSKDLVYSLKIIEDIIGEKVIGHRAASFSVTKNSLWAIDIMRENGIKYDSSIFPIFHDRYGIPDAPIKPYSIKNDFWEFPMTVVRIGRINFPIGGGGYLRFFPYWLTKWGIEKVNKQNRPAIIYIHPWEIDPQQPKLPGPVLSRFRHYHNLRKTESRLESLCKDFKLGPIKDLLSNVQC